MVFSRERLRGFIAGILATVGLWLIAFPLRDWLLENAPIHNTYVLGIILIIISWYISQSN